VSLIAVLVPDPSYFGALPSRILGSTLTGAWLLPVSAVFLATRARFQAERELLTRELLAHPPSASPALFDRHEHVSSVIRDVSDFIHRARVAVESHRARPKELRDYLESVLQRNLRELSHQLVSPPTRALTDFTAKDVVATTIRRKSYPMVWIALTHVGLTAPFVLFQVGLFETLGRAAVSTTLLLALFIILKNLPPTNLRWGVVQLAVGLVLWSGLNEVLNHALFGVFGSVGFVVTGLANIVLVGLETLLLGSITVAVADRREIRHHLTHLLGEKYWQRELSSLATITHRRDLAQKLHGTVQNALLATLERLKGNPSPAEIDDLAATLDSLEKHLSESHDSVLPSGVDVASGLHALETRWEGVIGITYDLRGHHELLGSESIRTILDIAEEAISNASRHGMSTEIHITVSATPEGVFVEALDNGIGPRQGDPGLGHALFSEITNTWSLKPRNDSAGSRLAIQWK
jgi:signal transduction histidine kinase